MNYLCITIRWLDDRYHGQDARAEPEWPPSPLRLFQAMLASAYRQGAETNPVLASFCWFQNLQAPIIVAPRTQPGQPYTRFVPNNDSDKDFERQYRLTDKNVRPTLLLDPYPIHYLWQLPKPLEKGAEEYVKVLCDTARSVVAFGWGVDMATGEGMMLSPKKAETLKGERWLPTSGFTEKRCRIPAPTTLNALIERHKQFVERLRFSDQLRNGCLADLAPLDESAFRIVGYRRSTEPPIRPCAAFAFYRTNANTMRSFSTTRAITVADMVRCLTGKTARQTGHCEPDANLDEWVNAYVMGHSELEGIRPRFSYLPLPSIRPPNTLGDIRRVIIAEPMGSSELHSAWAQRSLRGQFLVSEKQREEAILMSLTSRDEVLQRYTMTSETWATTTPVILPGSDEGKFAKAEKLFLKALRHAGYSADALAEFDFRNVSFWPGGDLALRFQRLDYLKKDHWSVYHVRIRWKQSIKGPLAIGAGRHCGLGIFAATSE